MNGPAAPSLASIQIGLPRSLGGGDAAPNSFDSPWTTGIFKEPVTGAVTVTFTGINGDGQADLRVHGGRDKAICAYAAGHYDYWRSRLALHDLPHGAFGENFTLGGLTEDQICIGDVWSIGELQVQVSQPRQPCWKLARKWRIKNFADDVINSGRTGWYFRVLKEGTVQAGAECQLVERRHPDWSITNANDAMYARPLVRDARARLAAVPELSEAWKRSLTK